MLRILVTKQDGDDKRADYIGSIMVDNRIIARPRIQGFVRARGALALLHAMLDQAEADAARTGKKLNLAAWQ